MSKHDQQKDDDYVAKLLAEDAKKSSQRYAAVGLSALLPKRPTNAAPKPNTRFLSHLVREVDSHNAALKKKEELEAKMRLRDMRAQDKRSRDYLDDECERKRRRTDGDSGRSRRSGHDRGRRRSASPHGKKRHRDEHRRKSHRHREERYDEDRKTARHRSQSPQTRPRRRRRSSPSASSKAHKLSHKSSRSTHSPARSRSLSRSSTTTDPLSDLIGPQPNSRSKAEPQPQVRGRGAQTSKSDIDKHFSSNYDPAMDVHPSEESLSEREDWDMALEALRDRTMWKKKQAERMKEAGFGEEEIERWKKGSGSGGVLGLDGGENGDVRDVKWKKRGEVKEWDLGKKGFDS